jgi:hypothetical protein
MSNDSASRNAAASNAQMNISVQPQYEIINMTTLNNSNLQKAAAIALDAQHTLPCPTLWIKLQLHTCKLNW